MADDERTAKRKRSVSPSEPARNAMEKLAETRAGGTYVCAAGATSCAHGRRGAC